jgi:hypothetical protein
VQLYIAFLRTIFDTRENERWRDRVTEVDGTVVDYLYIVASRIARSLSSPN